MSISDRVRALYEVSVEENLVDRVFSDIEVLKDIFADEELSLFLSNRSFKKEVKLNVLSDIIEKMCDLTKSFLLILLDDISWIGDKEVKGYLNLYKLRSGYLEAEVITAEGADDSLLAAAEKGLSSIYNKQVKAKSVTCPDLLGGIKLKIGYDIIDGSWSGDIDKMVRASECVNLCTLK